MKEYILNGKVITATEKAYRVIYKEQGFLPIDEVETIVLEEVVELPVEKEIKTTEEKVEETPKTEEKVEEEIKTTEETKKSRKAKKEN